MNQKGIAGLTNPKIFEPDGSIFVFGSNESGIHGAGAARLAHNKFGAVWGVGFGPTGSSFAIPTKDWKLEQLPLGTVAVYCDAFVRFAKKSNRKFNVTAVGCGLAGFTPDQIAPFFEPLTNCENINLPNEFWQIYIKK